MPPDHTLPPETTLHPETTPAPRHSARGKWAHWEWGSLRRKNGTMAEQERGQLRIYLGAAAGAGKTFDMLSEGHRRAERGADVVVAFVETHGRPHTAALLDGLEIIPRARGPLPGHDVRGDGPRRRAGPQARDRAGRRVRAHERARLAARQALGGRRGAAGGGHRRHLQRQHPAPRVPQRRRAEDHRRAAAGNRAGRHGPRRRPGRARRHYPRGAPPPDGARQHLPAGEDRRRADQLLPHRQPHRPARAGPALAGRQGGRGPAALPRPARHPRHLGGPRAGRGRADRRPGRRDADPPRGPDRRPVHRRGPARRARDPVRRPDRRGPGRAGRAAQADRVAGRDLPPGHRGRHPRGPAQLRPRRERHPAGARREPPVLAVVGADRAGLRRPDHPRLGRHRRAHRDPRAHGPGPRAAAPLPRRADAAPPAGRLRAGRGPLPAADPDAGQPARPAQPDQRRARVPGRGHRGRPGRRVRCPPSWSRWPGRCCSTTTSPRRCTSGPSPRPTTRWPWRCSWPSR